MKISILTLFPEMFEGPFSHSILKHAQEKKLAIIKIINIRDFGIGKHKIVDDKPYGGGIGMIMRVDVLDKAIQKTRNPKLSKKEQRVILLDPHGKTFTQNKADELSTLKHLILICGHYEGVDNRIKEIIDEEISIGNFIVTGGEIPAMLITDAVIRLIKSVLKEGVTEAESFSLGLPKAKKDLKAYYLEYPQYTRPKTYKSLSVPEILLGGKHQQIQKWRNEHTIKTDS